MKPMFKVFILIAALASFISCSFAQEMAYINEEALLDEEGTPSEYSMPLNETEMEKADLERQEDVLQPDDEHTDWNMDDVSPESDF
ncbi:hypothetical protein ACJVC5_12970 [Peredibacter sp. HCB2-198]|uniref:hypothetical protein n=1 Tax=Peredibacter sp. HCB2-198 TaxID=3383025 RepID=UPI0038B545E0